MIMMFLCLAGSILNVTISRLCFLAEIPLYMDTIFTISVTLTCGLSFGALCGALTNFISHSLWGLSWAWEGYLFMLCNIATAFVTWFFMRIFPRELNLTASRKMYPVYKDSLISKLMDRIIINIIFAFVLCIIMSITGGFLAAFIMSYRSVESGITSFFSATMFNLNTPLVFTEIASRIPVNIIDRLISVFAGYGAAAGFRRLLINRS